MFARKHLSEWFLTCHPSLSVTEEEIISEKIKKIRSDNYLNWFNRFNKFKYLKYVGSAYRTQDKTING